MLPEYFVIKNPENSLNTKWKEFIEWLNTTCNTCWIGTTTGYYGVDGSPHYKGASFYKELESFINNPVVLTLDEFFQMRDEFVLPKKWCVKRTKDNYQVLNKWLNTLSGKSGEYCIDCGYINSEDVYLTGDAPRASPHIRKGFTEITFEQFKKHILMQENKIIGYKCPTDLFNKGVIKGTIYVKSIRIHNGYYPKFNTSNDVYYMPQEIVETWEPVYEEEEVIKKGEYVVITELGIANDPVFTIGKVYRLTKDFTPEFGFEAEYDNTGSRINGWSNAFDLGLKIRKATQKEIDDSKITLLTLGDKGIAVTVSKGSIKADGKVIVFDDLKHLYDMMTGGRITRLPWDITFLSAKIGCSVFTHTEIAQIIDAYNKIN